MDIRSATAPKGTKQQKTVTPEMKKDPLPVIDKETPVEEAVKDEEDYGGDPDVIKAMSVVKDEGITKEELFLVLDTLISTGNVVWETTILGKIPCKFTVRPTWVADYIMDILAKKTENNTAITVGMYNNLVAEYNTASELAEFNGTHYGYTNQEQFDEVFKRVTNIPYALLAELSKKTVVFDNIILAATSDWCVKNFTKPRQDK